MEIKLGQKGYIGLMQKAMLIKKEAEAVLEAITWLKPIV